MRKQFERLLGGEHFYDHEYYNLIQTLAGMVYDEKEDGFIDEDLRQLSAVIQRLIAFKNMDRCAFEARGHMPSFYVDLASQNLHNLQSLQINYPRHIPAAPEGLQHLTESVRIMVEQACNCNVNIPRIIGWIRGKLYSADNPGPVTAYDE